MTRVRILVLATLVAATVPTFASTPCFAVGAGPNTARIVVEHDDDSATFCLSFEEEAITGYEALQRTGVEIVAEDYGAGQVTVCRIGGIGCAHPTQPCFCECPGSGPCAFWGYYRAHGDAPWSFSGIGPGATSVRDGDVEGWRYGLQQSGVGGNAPQQRHGRCVEHAAFLAGAATAPSSGSAAPLIGSLVFIVASAGLILLAARMRRKLA